MHPILANDVFKIEDLENYKLHLACRNDEGTSPLDVFVADKREWVAWNEWRGKRNDWTRDYIFSLIEFYPKRNSYLFGGVFKVIEDLGTSYHVKEVEEFKKFTGRVMIEFHRTQGLRGRAFHLETFIDKFTVSEIFPEVYTGEKFPGHQNINLDFLVLEHIFKTQKPDWKGPWRARRASTSSWTRKQGEATSAPPTAARASGRDGSHTSTPSMVTTTSSPL